MKIILDTNILLYSAKQKVDLVTLLKEKYGNISIVVPDLVRKELAKLTKSAKKGEDKRAAKLALQIVEFSKLKKEKISKPVDYGIVELARFEKSIVGTNDSELRKLLKENNIRVVYLKQHKLIAEA